MSKRRIRRVKRPVNQSRVHRKSNLIVSISLGTIALVLVAFSVFFWLGMRKKRPVEDQGDLVKFLQEAAEQGRVEVSGGEELNEDEVATDAERFKVAAQLAGDFIQMREVEEILSHIREPELHRASVEAFVAGPDFGSFTPMVVGRSGLEGLATGGFLEVITRDWQYRLLRIDLRSMQIDWETYLGYNPLKLEQIQAYGTHPAGIPVRCVREPLEPGMGYYNYDFAESEEWLSLKLSHPEFEDVIWGYVPRQSQLARLLAYDQSNKQGLNGFILRLRAPDEASAQRRQFEVIDVVATSWYISSTSRLADLLPEEIAAKLDLEIATENR